MRNSYYGVLIVLMLLLVSGCSQKEKVGTTTTEAVADVLSNGEYVEEVIELFKQDGLIINEPVWELSDITNIEGYEKVKTIVAFDSEEEQGNQGIASSGPSNKMRSGFLLEFASADDMNELIAAQKNRLYFDDMGVDANFISPLFFSNNKRLLVLQLNCRIAESKVRQFEKLLSIAEPSEKLTNWQLVENMTGEWSGAEGLTAIRLEEGKLRYGKLLLNVIGAADKKIYTHETANEKSFYSFVITDKGVTVLPSMDIEQTKGPPIKGGDLAPIEMVRSHEGLTIEKISGNWQSVEADYPGFIQLKATDSPHEMDVLISRKGTEADESIRLTAESYGGSNDFIDFVNEDQTMWYNFSYYKNDQWLFSSGTQRSDATGAGRPYILEQVD